MSKSPSDFDTVAPFNRLAFLENFKGLEVLAQNTIVKFNNNLPNLISALENAVLAKNFEEIEMAAHKLKGLVSIFHAEPSGLLAVQLEKLAKKKSLEGSEELLSSLKIELARLQKSLLEIIDTIA